MTHSTAVPSFNDGQRSSAILRCRDAIFPILKNLCFGKEFWATNYINWRISSIPNHQSTHQEIREKHTKIVSKSELAARKREEFKREFGVNRVPNMKTEGHLGCSSSIKGFFLTEFSFLYTLSMLNLIMNMLLSG